MAMIGANGIEMFHKQHGETGDWLLLIAGLGAHSGSFAPQIAAFVRALPRASLRQSRRGQDQTRPTNRTRCGRWPTMRPRCSKRSASRRRTCWA